MITAGFAVGDVVRVGAGKTVWKITGFGTWPNDGATYAILAAVEGYANWTATLDRLVMAS